MPAVAQCLAKNAAICRETTSTCAAAPFFTMLCTMYGNISSENRVYIATNTSTDNMDLTIISTWLGGHYTINQPVTDLTPGRVDINDNK